MIDSYREGNKSREKKMMAILRLNWMVVSTAQAVIVLMALLATDAMNHRIAFGSCFNPNKGDGIWRLIRTFEPNQLLLLGDQIYADFHPIYKYKRFNGSNPQMIEEEYEKLYNLPGFQSLVASLSHGWASTYDDHDYGKDNGDRTYKYRQESIDLFSRYNRPHHFEETISLPDPATGQLRTERKTGVFSSHEYSFRYSTKSDSEQFLEGVFLYKVLLLDARSNKDVRGTVGGDFLGEQQWRWLEYHLSEEQIKPFHLIIVGSGIQMLSDDKLVEESWAEFPEKREKLLSMLSRVSYSRNLLLLSGDIHCAEFSQMKCRRSNAPVHEERRLIEITSSGLSHTFTKIVEAPNVNNLHSPKIATNSRSFVMEFFNVVYQVLYPAAYREDKYGHIYQGVHFGLIDIHNDESDDRSEIKLSLTVQIINHEGVAVMIMEIPLRDQVSSTESRMPSEIICIPINGPIRAFDTLFFKANVAVAGIVFVILPLVTILWFTAAAIYYICIGKELRRREIIERNYHFYKEAVHNPQKKTD